jgi:hypothetical protein
MLSGNSMGGPLIIRIAAKLFPLRTPPEYVGLDLAALKSKYRKRDLTGVIAFLLLAPLSVRAWHQSLIAYAQRLTPHSDSGHYLTAGTDFWYVPAAFLGVVMACLLIHVGNRVLLPDGGREYRYSSNATAGFGASNMFLSFGVFFACGGLLLAYFASRTYLDLEPTELVVHRLWSLKEERHSYSHISALREAIDSTGQSSDFSIEFTDAEPWSTAQEVVFPEAEHKAFLEKMTGKKIETIAK